ncbi:phosphonate metabolism transcriptional regulator PhnF [Bordetella genomosp. 7]|uniref:phosphonate metabolism transcriptional regulator PhnF n=1 Tax=Bordetella genomosp. 7 TaxID=1416805 RepID=UPI000B9EA1CC|nr:phosphonate metabolism transcriptional regulator PhnF [Bordetella genomosp. 7]OZI21872.1 phosphonate metabolism transcriptional regulator PhnF [Bordetella genomosp. 7]
MVERGSGIAIWRQIGEQLAQDIRGRLYAPGERLPPEPELAAKFAVNRHTIRRAMSELEQSGLVRIEQGRGTFVHEHAIDYTIGKRTRFSENLLSQGMRGHFEVMGGQSLRSAEIARHLGLSRTASVLRVQALGKADNRCIDVSEHYLDERRFPGFIEQLRKSRSISRAYAHYGVADYTRKWSRITAALPSADTARLLGQPKTRPILQVEALSVDSAGAPLQYSVTRFAGDLVQLLVSDDAT